MSWNLFVSGLVIALRKLIALVLSHVEMQATHRQQRYKSHRGILIIKQLIVYFLLSLNTVGGKLILTHPVSVLRSTVL